MDKLHVMYVNSGDAQNRQKAIRAYIKTLQISYGLIFLAETCGSNASLEPYYKKAFHSTDFERDNRGISVYYDPSVLSPDKIEIVDKFDILSVKFKNEYVIGVYRNHRHEPDEFLCSL